MVIDWAGEGFAGPRRLFDWPEKKVKILIRLFCCERKTQFCLDHTVHLNSDHVSGLAGPSQPNTLLLASEINVTLNGCLDWFCVLSCFTVYILNFSERIDIFSRSCVHANLLALIDC